MPGAALFFTAYERTKHNLGAENTSAQVCAASVGETVACSVRVPVENVKQNQQAGKIDARLLSGASQILRGERRRRLLPRLQRHGWARGALRDDPDAPARVGEAGVEEL